MRSAALVLIAFLATASLAQAQEAIYLVRHADRADQSSDSPLSSAGMARAEHLARVLHDAGITKIFTTDLKRTIDTAAPCARDAHVTAQALPAADISAVVAGLHALGAHDRALVVGHSNTLPQILAGLGVSASIAIPDSEYDNLFVVVPRRGAAPALLRLRY